MTIDIFSNNRKVSCLFKRRISNRNVGVLQATSLAIAGTRRWPVWAVLALMLTACQTAPVSPLPPQFPPQIPPPESPGASSPAAAASAPTLPALIPTRQPRLPRIGLALGGGAARGFAHVGVIQVLEEAGIRADLVVGTSAGSLVATLYASGKSGVELSRLSLGMDESAISDWTFPGRGLLRGDALARYVREQTAGKSIEQLSLPLGIVATDLDTGTGILFQRGDPGAAVRASSAVPAVFQPVRIGNHEYVDGGLVSPVPVSFARQMGAELVIAVDISSPPDGADTGDAFHMLMQTFTIMGRSINQFELRDADLVVRPKLTGIGSADFTARKRSIDAGRDAAQALIGALRARIKALTR
jgi:NTE family protein